MRLHYTTLHYTIPSNAFGFVVGLAAPLEAEGCPEPPWSNNLDIMGIALGAVVAAACRPVLSVALVDIAATTAAVIDRVELH